ncbi:MAG TPA: alpha/beta fold hydrolase [Thermoanaerobaculia bacterium]
MSPRSCLFLILILLAGCSSGGPHRTSWLRPCRVPGVGFEARCGAYEVFEDRDARAGRKIGLHVVVLPAHGATPAPDPIFYLDGGPGGAATEAAADLVEALGPALEDRDLVLIDQRGTGASNPLDCDLSGPMEDLFQREALRRCRETLERTAGLTLYTTPVAMGDLDEIRQALGYERINLLGASYGSQAALVYMRSHPSAVRSAVLVAAGPVGLSSLYVARDMQRALDLLLADCAADPACRSAFPDVRAELSALIRRLEAEPARVEIADPESGEPVTVVLTADLLRLTLPYRLYSPGPAARIPLSIHKASQGDLRELARVALVVRRSLWGGESQGMTLSINCALPADEPSPEQVAEATRGTLLGDLRVRLDREYCALWPRAEMPPGYSDPVRSDVPTLLLTGDRDPVLPPVWAEEVARHLPNGRLVVIPNASHFPVNDCTRSLIAGFLAAGSAERLDTACVPASPRTPFALTPRPPLPSPGEGEKNISYPIPPLPVTGEGARG